jgi:hypothetical protein
VPNTGPFVTAGPRHAAAIANRPLIIVKTRNRRARHARSAGSFDTQGSDTG